MSSRYPVAEMVTTINVAIKSHASTAFVRRSNFIIELANVLYLNGFIQSFSVRDNGVMFFLKYQNSKSVISSLKIISRTGKRAYWGLAKLSLRHNSKAFSGHYIVSTPQGLLTSSECLLLNHIGGEVILKVEV